jgi:hypothetical protein
VTVSRVGVEPPGLGGVAENDVQDRPLSELGDRQGALLDPIQDPFYFAPGGCGAACIGTLGRLRGSIDEAGDGGQVQEMGGHFGGQIGASGC